MTMRSMHDHSPHGHGHAHASRDAPDPHDAHAHGDAGGVAAFRTSTLLNLLLVAVEAAVALWIGSMALLADAGHNLGDVLGLVLAWGAAKLALRAPSARHTYGYARTTILAALVNAALLLAACGA